MKDVSNFSKVLLGIRPVDFRKHANGLSTVVKETLESQPFDPKLLFVFVNKRKTAIRMLYWDLTGFATWNKQLEKDRFKWPKNPDEAKMMLTPRQLKWLLQGIDLEKIKIHVPVTFNETF